MGTARKYETRIKCLARLPSQRSLENYLASFQTVLPWTGDSITQQDLLLIYTYTCTIHNITCYGQNASVVIREILSLH